MLGLDSDLLTSARVLDAIREGIRIELKRTRERLASINQMGLPL